MKRWGTLFHSSSTTNNLKKELTFDLLQCHTSHYMCILICYSPIAQYFLIPGDESMQVLKMSKPDPTKRIIFSEAHGQYV